MRLVFATGNTHKVAEAAAILGDSVAEVTGYSGPSPVEDGVSFLENALIKARAAHAATGEASFADDSGIAVEILGGAPGIFSAGWSGTRDDAANRELLLAQLVDVKDEHRAAAFVCTVALVTDAGEISFTGVWPGRIARESRGSGGFGYDPVFIADGFELTAAELAPEVKNSFSHRSIAMRQLAEYLAANS